MSGTKAGGAKAAQTNRERYGKDWYALIGAKGGLRSMNGGFASHKIGKDGLTGLERSRIAGAKGGSISRRGRSKNKKVSIDVEFVPTQDTVEVTHE